MVRTRDKKYEFMQRNSQSPLLIPTASQPEFLHPTSFDSFYVRILHRGNPREKPRLTGFRRTKTRQFVMSSAHTSRRESSMINFRRTFRINLSPFQIQEHNSLRKIGVHSRVTSHHAKLYILHYGISTCCRAKIFQIMRGLFIRRVIRFPSNFSAGNQKTD